MKRIAKVLSFFLLLNLFFIKQVSAANLELDTSFGTGGIVVSTFGGSAILDSLATNSSGEIYAVGYMFNGVNVDSIIAKYSKTGQPVESFGVLGRKVEDNSGNDFWGAITVDSTTGEFVVGGYSDSINSSFNWKLKKYDSNGNIVTNFGNNGIIQPGIRGLISSLVKQPDGKIVAIGYFIGVNNGNDDVALVRYNSDGSIDNSFGNQGIVTTPIGGSNDRGVSGVLQQDGKIVVFGDFSTGANDLFVVRYNSDGSLDNSFGVSGKVTLQIQSNNGARDVAIQSDGKIIGVGGSSSGLFLDSYLFRLETNGSLDQSFGNGGKVAISYSSGHDFYSSVIITQDNKILTGGGQDENGKTNFVIRKYNLDGTLDSGFGNNGAFIESVGNYDSQATDILLNEGKILASGNVSNGSYEDWGIIRIKPTSSIPLLKQTDGAWGNDIYDSASLWSSVTGMSRWGCAVTSAAMVFQYNALTKMPDNSNLTPGSLNSWLKAQPDGYIRNGLLNWLALSRLSKQAAPVNGVSFDALEYSRINGRDDAALTTSLNNQNPPILEEPGHFVVATGIDSPNSTFLINDPYYDKTSLADPFYNKNYLRMGTYTPVNSDLSYMMFVVNPYVNITLKDQNGNSVGESYIQDPINDPLATAGNSVGPLKVYVYKKPLSGKYVLELTSTNGNPYSLDQNLYDKDGNVKTSSFTGNLGTGITDTFVLNFDKDNTNNTTSELITFDYIKKEIITGYNQKNIKNFITYAALLAQLEIAKKSKNVKIEKGILDVMSVLIKSDKKIDPSFSAILLADIKALKNSL